MPPHFSPRVSTAQQRAPGNESITQADLRADLFFLAGDAMRGRLTDTNENRATADYIRARFERAGLKPVAGNSYFHNYNLMTATLGEGNEPDARRWRTARRARIEERAGILSAAIQRAAARVTAPVVFAGFGITAPKWNHDDYKGDVKRQDRAGARSRARRARSEEPVRRRRHRGTRRGWRKALAAQEKGAAGILFVSDVHNHPDAGELRAGGAQLLAGRRRRASRTTRSRRGRIASAFPRRRSRRRSPRRCSPAPARRLTELGKHGRNRAAASRRRRSPDSRSSCSTAVDRHIVPDRNVLGLIEGSDPKLKDEWVLVTAHFDHDGVNGTQILNGADDNGSGTVALLEIADAYALAAQQGQRPKRSVLFCAWNSEERGLLGAWAYTEFPPAPLANIAGVLNMDMIGRNEEVQVGGGNRFNGLEVQTAESNANAVNMMGFARAPELAAVVDAANAGIGLDIKKRYDNNTSNLVRRSDQWPFLQRGVPALGFMTGLHPDYHTQYDRPEKINYAKMEKIARLIHQASWNLANAAARPKNT